MRVSIVGLGLAAVLALPTAARAQGLLGPSLQDKANGVLRVLAFTAIPDSTTSSLQINSASSGDPRLQQTQFGGAFTWSDDLPLYLEGFAGASRYDPVFVFSGGTDEREIPTRWTGVVATGGVGWDFPVVENVVFRPIANVSLGYVTSDINLARIIFTDLDDDDIAFLDDGDLFSWGLGGSVMLDYELKRPDYEIDVELRYTHLHLESFESDRAVQGSADSQTAALWSRLRVPTGHTVFGRPLRTVTEFAHSHFLGPDSDALGFDRLSQIGLGLEIDTEADDIVLTRTRLVGRYMFGNDVSGFSVGIGISF